MRNWFKRKKSPLKNQKGQSTTEYVLILFVVLLIAVQAKKKLLDIYSNAAQGVSDQSDDFFKDTQ